MDRETKEKVIKLLIKENRLVKNWIDFYDRCGLCESEKLELQKELKNQNLSNLQLFTEIITGWILTNKSAATIDQLSKILRDMNFHFLAENILSDILPPKRDVFLFAVPSKVKTYKGRPEEVRKLLKIIDATKHINIQMEGLHETELHTDAVSSDICSNCIWLDGTSDSSLQNSIARLSHVLNIPVIQDKMIYSIERSFLKIHSVLTQKYKTETIIIIENVFVATDPINKLLQTLAYLSFPVILCSRNVSCAGFFGNVIYLNSVDENEQDKSPESNLKVQQEFACEEHKLERALNVENEAKEGQLERMFFADGQPRSIFFEIKNVVKHFQGRSEELKELYHWFESETKLCRIIGLGGIGKSELAKQFATINRSKANCVWFNGDSQESLQQSVIRFAIYLKVPTTLNNQTRDNTNIIKDTDSAIRRINRLPSIIIVDNVDSTNKSVVSIIKTFITLSYFTIATSQNVSSLDYAGNLIKLTIFSTADAIQLVKNSFPDESERNIKALCELLGNFPLALQQAIAYIRQQKLKSCLGETYAISTYLDIEKQLKGLLEFPLNEFEHDYCHTTLITWNMSVDQIGRTETIGPVAVELLNIIAYFEPDRIRVAFLTELYREQIGGDINVVQETHKNAVELLKDYCLIQIENNNISIHRLVQEVTRLNLSTAGRNKAVLSRWIGAVNCKINDLISQDMSHILSVCNYFARHPDLAKQYEKLPLCISKKLHALSMYREMLTFAYESHDLLKNIFGEGALQTMMMESQVALALMYSGKYQESLEIYKIAYNKMQQTFGIEHPETLSFGYHMATVYTRLEKYEEALKLFKSVLDAEKEVLGENHPNTAATKGEIASVLVLQKKYSLAMEMYEELLKWGKRNFGEEDPVTLGINHNVAYCLQLQGDLKKAREMFEQGLELRIKVQGEEHAATLQAKFTLALLLDKFGEKGKALEMLEQLLPLREKVLGPDHPYTEETRQTISTMQRDILKTEAEKLMNQEKYLDAMEIYEEMLEREKREIGEEDPDTLSTKFNIAHCLRMQGDFEKANEAFEQVRKARVKVLGEEHAQTLGTKRMVALTFYSLGEMLEQVLPVQEKVLGPDHPDTVRTRQIISHVLIQI